MIDAVVRALPRATPDVIAELVFAQLPHLGERDGLRLLDAMFGALDPVSWGHQVDDAALDRWPGPVAARVLERGRATLEGQDRLLFLCHVARRCTPEEQREVLDAMVSGAMPEWDWACGIGHTRSEEFSAFARSLPPALQGEWVAWRRRRAGAQGLNEACRAWRALGAGPEGAVRGLWDEVRAQGFDEWDAWLAHDHLLPLLPPDLRTEAAAHVRAMGDARRRRWCLRMLGDELTDEERIDLVENPGNLAPPTVAAHLRQVQRHLPRVPMALRLRWLAVVRDCDEDQKVFRQHGLIALLPSLEGRDRKEVAEEIVAQVLSDTWFATDDPWELVSDDALAPVILERVRSTTGGWDRDSLIAHFTIGRDPTLTKRAITPVLAELGALEPDLCLETVGALTPWLARETANAFPRAVAALEIPVPSQPPDQWVRFRRIVAAGR